MLECLYVGYTLKVPFFKLKSKKKVEAEGEEEVEKLIKESAKKEEPIGLGEIPKLRDKPPRLIFIGSSKGGCGKSFIASNLVVAVSTLSPSKQVFAVDLDLDNYTLSETLPPYGIWAALEERIQKTGARCLSVADIIHEGSISSDRMIPRFKSKTLSCTGVQLEYEFRLIPAYDFNILRRREQMTILRTVDSRLLRKGVEVLLEYFRARINRNDDLVVVFDGKQKSNIGIEYEPMYRLLVDESDLFMLVTEPPYLNFNELTMPYKRALDKTMILVNKATRPSIERITLLVSDALSNNVPVFIIPHVDEDGKMFSSTERRAPVAVRLNTKSGIYTVALAYFLGLLDDTVVKNSGCEEDISRILSATRHICRSR